ncbi:PepSY-like domain-containing protein [Fibrella sp. HMF5335]|uniref:PepSY-like domain-containing protein n=1 Tax=Fibrella rubiginis TaxID=2817060 RepID=A0A939K0R7_9BACT|nr:PepSY-like domain-containing protein [Fibrella rubiginis]MBO0936382.1 PepSY-like domain-containing protein [Fibrella rubiginis]
MKMYQSAMLSCFFLVSGYSVTAQKLKANQVPAPVQQAFKGKFARATDIDWKKEGNQYKASFDMGDVDHDVFYNAAGKLVSHSYEIKVAELPAAVQAAAKTNFPKHKLDDPERVETNGTVTYKVELDGRPDMKAVFAADGKLISKKEDID